MVHGFGTNSLCDASVVGSPWKQRDRRSQLLDILLDVNIVECGNPEALPNKGCIVSKKREREREGGKEAIFWIFYRLYPAVD